MIRKSVRSVAIAASGLILASGIVAASGAAAATPGGAPAASVQHVTKQDNDSTRVREIVQATDNHDGVKGWVYNKTSRTLLVHIGSKYQPDCEHFFLQPGQDFTYACGATLNLQFQQNGDNACVSAEDPAASKFKVWDWQNLTYRTMSEEGFFEYDDTSGVSHLELKRKKDGNRGILGENGYTTDWANLDVVVTDAK